MMDEEVERVEEQMEDVGLGAEGEEDDGTSCMGSGSRGERGQHAEMERVRVGEDVMGWKRNGPAAVDMTQITGQRSDRRSVEKLRDRHSGELSAWSVSLIAGSHDSRKGRSDIGREEDDSESKSDVDFAEGDEEARGRNNLAAEMAEADVSTNDQHKRAHWGTRTKRASGAA